MSIVLDTDRSVDRDRFQLLCSIFMLGKELECISHCKQTQWRPKKIVSLTLKLPL
jgi:hypothetical protein